MHHVIIVDIVGCSCVIC